MGNFKSTFGSNKRQKQKNPQDHVGKTTKECNDSILQKLIEEWLHNGNSPDEIEVRTRVWDAFAAGTVVKYESYNLELAGKFSLRNRFQLEDLPPFLVRIEGSLDLSGCSNLYGFPPGFSMSGTLNLQGCKGITTLPQSLLESNISIDIENSGITKSEIVNIETGLREKLTREGNATNNVRAILTWSGQDTRNMRITSTKEMFSTSDNWNSLQSASAAKSKGNEEFAKKYYDKAIHWYSKAINIDPNNYVFYANRGAAYLMLQQFVPAAQDCEQCIELNHNCWKAYVRAAKAYMFQGMYEEGLLIVRKYTHRPAREQYKLLREIELEIENARKSRWRPVVVQSNMISWEPIIVSESRYFVCSEFSRGSYRLCDAMNSRIPMSTFVSNFYESYYSSEDAKRQWIRMVFEQLRIKPTQGYQVIEMKIRRAFLLEDSITLFRQINKDDLRYTLRFKFQDEEGLDAGGVAREWFSLITKELLNADIGLFRFVGDSDENDFACHINPKSGLLDPHHLDYFHCLGRIIGKALLDGRSMPANFSQLMYKLILGLPIGVEDVKMLDTQMYRSIKVAESCDNIEELALTFSVAMSFVGTCEEVELKPNGSTIDVTESNKDEYLELLVKNILFERIKPQISALLNGLHDVIPKGILNILSPSELETLLCGLPTIDIEDWRRNTDYIGYTGKEKVITWFWEVIASFEHEKRSSFLHFVTGSGRVPVQGFGMLPGTDGNIQRFTIRLIKNEDSFPVAHTCFNRIDLPPYRSKTILKKKLLVAVQYAEGFGIE